MSTAQDDGIEILSCHIEADDDDDDDDDDEGTLGGGRTESSFSSVRKPPLVAPDDPAQKQRKRVARAVAIVSFLLLLFSVVLIGVSLNMSKNIDELVRESNEVLRKHSEKQSNQAASQDVMAQNLTSDLVS